MKTYKPLKPGDRVRVRGSSLLDFAMYEVGIVLGMGIVFLKAFTYE